MDVHASPTTVPERDEFLAAFQGHLRRPEGEEALERYVTGLLTELAPKNCDTQDQAVPGNSEQRLQEFLTNMQWDHDDLNHQRVAKMSAEATVGQGALIVDDTGFQKGQSLGGSGAAVYRHPWQGGQLPGGGDMLL